MFFFFHYESLKSLLSALVKLKSPSDKSGKDLKDKSGKDHNLWHWYSSLQTAAAASSSCFTEYF